MRIMGEKLLPIAVAIPQNRMMARKQQHSSPSWRRLRDLISIRNCVSCAPVSDLSTLNCWARRFTSRKVALGLYAFPLAVRFECSVNVARTADVAHWNLNANLYVGLRILLQTNAEKCNPGRNLNCHVQRSSVD